MKKLFYTPIPKFTDTTNEPHIKELKDKYGSEFIVTHMRIMWSLWTGEGLITEDWTSSEDLAKIFYDMYVINTEDIKIETIRIVIDLMLEYGMIASRPYSPQANTNSCDLPLVGAGR